MATGATARSSWAAPGRTSPGWRSRSSLDQGDAILSTIGIPFPFSTRIHEYEAYITRLNTEKKNDIREGLATGF